MGIKQEILRVPTWVEYDSLRAQLDMRERCGETAEKYSKALGDWIEAAMPVLEAARDEAPGLERQIKVLLDAYLDL